MTANIPSSEPINPALNPEAPARKKIERHTFKPQMLTGDKGLRALYEASSNLKLNPRDSLANLTAITNLVREWHYNLMPKYSLELFLDRCQAMGKQKEVQSFMDKMRRVHKGEDKWDEGKKEEDEVENSKRDDRIKEDEDKRGAPQSRRTEGGVLKRQQMEAAELSDSDDQDELLELMQRNKANLLNPKKGNQTGKAKTPQGEPDYQYEEDNSIEDFYVPPGMQSEMSQEVAQKKEEEEQKPLRRLQRKERSESPSPEPRETLLE